MSAADYAQQEGEMFDDIMTLRAELLRDLRGLSSNEATSALATLLAGEEELLSLVMYLRTRAASAPPAASAPSSSQSSAAKLSSAPYASEYEPTSASEGSRRGGGGGGAISLSSGGMDNSAMNAKQENSRRARGESSNDFLTGGKAHASQWQTSSQAALSGVPSSPAASRGSSGGFSQPPPSQEGFSSKGQGAARPRDQGIFSNDREEPRPGRGRSAQSRTESDIFNLNPGPDSRGSVQRKAVENNIFGPPETTSISRTGRARAPAPFDTDSPTSSSSASRSTYGAPPSSAGGGDANESGRAAAARHRQKALSSNIF